MGFYVERKRIRKYDQPVHNGQVRYSKTFATRHAAEREAAAWRSTGDFEAEVHEGRSLPNPKKGSKGYQVP